MTRIVASLTQTTPDAMLEAARAAEANLVEARLDLLDDLNTDMLAALARAMPMPAIATLRPEWEGGGFKQGEHERHALLRAAVDAGFPYVDVEARAAFVDDFIRYASKKDARVILSRHNFERTPAPAEIVQHLLHAREVGAWAGKFATHVRDARDAEALIAAAIAARNEGVRFALMGVNDAFLRLMAPALSMTLAYARPAHGSAAAAGQLPVPALQAAYAGLPPGTPTATTKLVLLLGDPVEHSLSPVFQNAAFRAAGVDATYVAARVRPDDLQAALGGLKSLNALGANVTVPHKEAAARVMDELHPTAREIKAVNTVLVQDGRLVGYNTDGTGALRALHEANVPYYQKRAVVLGAGGAARAVAFALEDAGASVTILNRTPERAQALAKAVNARAVPWDDLPKALSEADLLVNCTTVGMRDRDGTPVPADMLREDLAVFDAVYREDGITRLVREARAKGAPVVPGEAMLLHQGAAAFEVWTGKPAPLDAMREALEVHRA